MVEKIQKITKEDVMEITKIFRFEAAHRLLDSYTIRCQSLHGHSYVVELTLEGPVKDDGMVIDFSLVKETCSHIIDAFDHSIIVCSEDTVMIKLAPYLSSRFVLFPFNPTAENMASYFYEYIASILDDKRFAGIRAKAITVWETVTGRATCTQSTGIINNCLVSSAVAEKWSKEEKEIFTNNNGIIVPTLNPISTIDKMIFSEEGILNITATTKKNCK